MAGKGLGAKGLWKWKGVGNPEIWRLCCRLCCIEGGMARGKEKSTWWCCYCHQHGWGEGNLQGEKDAEGFGGKTCAKISSLGQILQRGSIAFSKPELKRGSSGGVAGGFLDPAGLGAKCETIHEEWAGNEG